MSPSHTQRAELFVVWVSHTCQESLIEFRDICDELCIVLAIENFSKTKYKVDEVDRKFKYRLSVGDRQR